MRHDIIFSYEGDLSYDTKYKGICLEIFQDDKKVGTLSLGKGGLNWMPKGKQKPTRYLEWEKLPDIFKSQGKPIP